jgi:hypothetical protein
MLCIEANVLQKFSDKKNKIQCWGPDSTGMDPGPDSDLDPDSEFGSGSRKASKKANVRNLKTLC